MEVLAVILGMALVTYSSRWLPVALFSRRPLPGGVARWLEHVPPAALSALLAPLVFDIGPGPDLAFRLVAASAALAVAWWKRSLTLTVIVGVVAMYLARRW